MLHARHNKNHETYSLKFIKATMYISRAFSKLLNNQRVLSLLQAIEDQRACRAMKIDEQNEHWRSRVSTFAMKNTHFIELCVDILPFHSFELYISHETLFYLTYGFK